MIGYVERARTEFQHLPPLHRNSIRRRGRTGCTSGGKSLWQHTFAIFPGVEARISISNLSANERIIVDVDVDAITKRGREETVGRLIRLDLARNSSVKSFKN